MKLKSAALAALIGTLAMTAFADVDWMIRPEYSSSGRMMLHGTRDAGRGDRIENPMRGVFHAPHATMRQSHWGILRLVQ